MFTAFTIALLSTASVSLYPRFSSPPENRALKAIYDSSLGRRAGATFVASYGAARAAQDLLQSYSILPPVNPSSPSDFPPPVYFAWSGNQVAIRPSYEVATIDSFSWSGYRASLRKDRQGTRKEGGVYHPVILFSLFGVGCWVIYRKGLLNSEASTVEDLSSSNDGMPLLPLTVSSAVLEAPPTEEGIVPVTSAASFPLFSTSFDDIEAAFITEEGIVPVTPAASSPLPTGFDDIEAGAFITEEGIVPVTPAASSPLSISFDDIEAALVTEEGIVPVTSAASSPLPTGFDDIGTAFITKEGIVPVTLAASSPLPTSFDDIEAAFVTEEGIEPVTSAASFPPAPDEDGMTFSDPIASSTRLQSKDNIITAASNSSSTGSSSYVPSSLNEPFSYEIPFDVQNAFDQLCPATQVPSSVKSKVQYYVISTATELEETEDELSSYNFLMLENAIRTRDAMDPSSFCPSTVTDSNFLTGQEVSFDEDGTCSVTLDPFTLVLPPSLQATLDDDIPPITEDEIPFRNLHNSPLQMGEENPTASGEGVALSSPDTSYFSLDAISRMPGQEVTIAQDGSVSITIDPFALFLQPGLLATLDAIPPIIDNEMQLPVTSPAFSPTTSPSMLPSNLYDTSACQASTASTSGGPQCGAEIVSVARGDESKKKKKKKKKKKTK